MAYHGSCPPPHPPVPHEGRVVVAVGGGGGGEEGKIKGDEGDRINSLPRQLSVVWFHSTEEGQQKLHAGQHVEVGVGQNLSRVPVISCSTNICCSSAGLFLIKFYICCSSAGLFLIKIYICCFSAGL